MNKFIKNVGLGVSALAMSFATVAAAPIASLTYAEETKPSCATNLGEKPGWVNCISATGSMDPDTYQSTGQYTIRKGGIAYTSSPVFEEAKDFISYKIKDQSIATFVEEEHTSGEYKYTSTNLHGLKVGKTELVYTLKSTGEAILTVPITVFQLDYDNYTSIAVGASRTFDIKAGSDIELTNVEVASGMSKYATLKANGGSSYTLTVNSMPYGLIGLGAEEEEPIPFVNLTIDSKNKATGKKNATEYMVFTVYEANAEDAASESTAKMATEVMNVAKLRETTSALVDAIFNEETTITDSSVVTLSDGSKFSANDIAGLREAVQAGETIKVALAKPAAIGVTDSAITSKMEAQLPENTKGARYLDINVLVSAGNKTFGNITEVGSPLTVSVDVSEDGAPAAGYARSYYVVRLHDGVAERLDAAYDADSKTVSFDSDKFSTYLIAYEDTKSIAAPDSGFSTKSDENSSASYVALMALAALVTIFGAAVIIKKHHA